LTLCGQFEAAVFSREPREAGGLIRPSGLPFQPPLDQIYVFVHSGAVLGAAN